MISIYHHYEIEALHGCYGAVAGGLLFIAGLLLLTMANPQSLLKGLSVPLLVFGLIIGMGGATDSYFAKKRQAMEYNEAFLKNERIKVEQTHRSWTGIRIFWSALALGGLLLAATAAKPYLLGIGLGTLLLGILTVGAETLSMKFNEQYYQEVINYKK